MDIFSYIVRYDSGFAPNPYHGVCTLACCKPKIRAAASARDGGDWVMGTAPSPLERHLIYLMKVSRTLTFDLYWQQYPEKRNSPANPRGDNIYEPIGGSPSGFRQLENPAHDSRHRARDLSENRVLISDHFFYFGKNAPLLSPEYANLVHNTQGHKRIRARCDNRFALFDNLLAWVEKNWKPGIHGEPSDEELICMPEEEPDIEE